MPDVRNPRTHDPPITTTGPADQPRSRADAFFDRRVSTWTDGCDRSIATVDRAIGAIGARSGRDRGRGGRASQRDVGEKRPGIATMKFSSRLGVAMGIFIATRYRVVLFTHTELYAQRAPACARDGCASRRHSALAHVPHDVWSYTNGEKR